jgi:arginase
MNLRIVSVPYRYDERDDGLGLGPQAILDSGLVDALESRDVHVTGTSTAILPDDERVDSPVAANIGRLGAHLGKLVAESRDAGDAVLMLAGDDTAGVGVISGLQRSQGAGHKVGIVWLDAHGDFNTPETSVSNILAGMPLAILAGLAGPLWRESAMLAAVVPTDRMLIAGIRELDDQEAQLLRSTNVHVLRHAEAVSGSMFDDSVNTLADKVDELYVHIDLDVLDPSLVPSSSTPSPHGMSIDQLAGLLESAFSTNKVGVLGVAGLNPLGGKRGERSIDSTKSLLVDALPRWRTFDALTS